MIELCSNGYRQMFVITDAPIWKFIFPPQPGMEDCKEIEAQGATHSVPLPTHARMALMFGRSQNFHSNCHSNYACVIIPVIYQIIFPCVCYYVIILCLCCLSESGWISLVPSFWKDADRKHKFRGFSRQKFLLIFTWSLWSHWLSRNIIQLAWMWTSVEVCWELPLTCCSLSSLVPKRQTWRHLTKLQPTCKCWPCLRCSYRGEPTIPPIIVCSRYASNSLFLGLPMGIFQFSKKKNWMVERPGNEAIMWE